MTTVAFIGKLFQEALVPAYFVKKALDLLIEGMRAIEQGRAARLLLSFCDASIRNVYMPQFRNNLQGVFTSYSGKPVAAEELVVHDDVGKLHLAERSHLDRRAAGLLSLNGDLRAANCVFNE